MISVIIPTFNRSDNLERAVSSVLACTGQFEIIVVDDNGVGTECQLANEKVLNKYFPLNNFVYLTHEKNMNGATARNTGLTVAKGEYVTFLDDDDEFLPDRISSLERIISSSNPDFIFSNVIVKKRGLYELVTNFEVKSKEEYQKVLLNCESFFGTGSNLVCKKTLVDKIGGFDTSYIRHQDFEFMLRYLDVCDTVVLVSDPTIIKNNDDRQNNPNIEKAEYVKQKYLSDYAYIAQRYSIEDQKEFQVKMYNDLLFQALIHRKKELIKKYKKEIEAIGTYSNAKMLKRIVRYRLRCMSIVSIIRNSICKSKIERINWQ